MAHSEHWELVALDSPDRCQASFGNGQQCCVKKVPGTEFCIKHQSHKRNGNMYKVGAFKQRFEELVSHPDLRTLNEEVAVLRMTLESLISQTGGNQKTLILFSSKIVELIRGVRETITSCHRLELQTGKLLDKSQIITLAERIIAIISNHITDVAVLEQISEEIAQAIDQTAVELVKDWSD